MHRVIAVFLMAVVVAGCGKPGGSGASSGSTGGAASSTQDTVSTVQQKLKADKELSGA